MGQDIYTPFWKEVLVQLKGEFKKGQHIVQFPIPEIKKLGNRNPEDYHGYVKFRFGSLQGNKDSAPYRDLAEAIKNSYAIKPYLNNELEIKVDKNLILHASYKTITPADLIAAYKKIIAKGNDGELYKWTELANKHFDLDAPDFTAMFKAINFHNLIFYNAKGVIYHLLENFPEEVRAAFKELFNEKVVIESRIDDFRNTMELLYRKIEPVQSHHQDERSIATYLTYNNPDKYALYKNGFYLAYCKLLNVPEAGTNRKYVHYLQLLREFTDNYVRKDNELLSLVAKFKPKNGYSDPNYTLLTQDILYQTLEGSWEEDALAEVETSSPLKNSYMPALNTILYGPPGTGKTYNTINKAVSIANPAFLAKARTREEIRKEYERLKNDGQIEFITFHQSMSYEDFIEGIKPKILSGEETAQTNLGYEVKEGIFKRIADRAAYQPTKQTSVFSLTEDEFSRASFYKISLGNTAIEDDEQIYRYCIDNGYIALGWGGANNFAGMSEHQIQGMVPGQLEKFEAQAVNYFIHFVKIDDFVVVSYGNLRFRAIGKVTGDYEYKNVDGLEVKQFRKVQWLLKDVDIPVEELYNKQFSQQSIYKLNRSEIKKEFFVKGQTIKVDAIKKKNFVLIIDEINRGNIAQIFGELITLIEPDKRKGASEALEAILPYSKEQFGVPDNLYIIGTMNTADRSVEALDTALRRRFMFQEMQPNPELLSQREVLRRFWNKPEYVNVEFEDWVKEPYLSASKPLYELIGFARDKEERIHDVNSERLEWLEEDMKIFADDDFTGINLELMLRAINTRLGALLSKDHLIGHAWLMNVYSITDLRAAFKEKLLPLLQEYFYNNYSKIGLVLGSKFFQEPIKVSKVTFAKFDNGADIIEELSDKVVYRLKDIEEITVEDFISIYS